MKTFNIWNSNKSTFFVFKRVKSTYKDDVLYDSQLIITQFWFVDSTHAFDVNKICILLAMMHL